VEFVRDVPEGDKRIGAPKELLDAAAKWFEIKLSLLIEDASAVKSRDGGDMPMTNDLCSRGTPLNLGKPSNNAEPRPETGAWLNKGDLRRLFIDEQPVSMCT
jgi:hypothetical protein